MDGPLGDLFSDLLRLFFASNENNMDWCFQEKAAHIGVHLPWKLGKIFDADCRDDSASGQEMVFVESRLSARSIPVSLDNLSPTEASKKWIVDQAQKIAVHIKQRGAKCSN